MNLIQGGYGDFGRYIFQAALSDFEGVDVQNAYLYAMNYVFNVLKYSNDYLGECDRLKGYYQYSRHNSRKIERIGKKYQWIAFYNTLSHVADNYKLSYEGGSYTGTWKLYVRDFDPTISPLMLEILRQIICSGLGYLNQNFLMISMLLLMKL